MSLDIYMSKALFVMSLDTNPLAHSIILQRHFLGMQLPHLEHHQDLFTTLENCVTPCNTVHANWFTTTHTHICLQCAVVS